MEFEDNKNNKNNKDNKSIQNSQNSDSGDNILTNILLIALGAAIVYFLLKGNQNQQVQAQSQVQAQYDNDEQWHIQRGDNGFIEDLKVGRHANVGNGNINSNSEYTNNYINTDNNSDSIDRKQLSKYINELVNKNISERMSMMNIDSTNSNINRVKFDKFDDRERRRRFGMS